MAFLVFGNKRSVLRCMGRNKTPRAILRYEAIAVEFIRPRDNRDNHKDMIISRASHDSFRALSMS